MNKNNFINFLGIIFLLFGISAVINTTILNGFSNVLWLCYFGLVFIGIGALTKNSRMIKAQINILAIPLIIWTIDFFYFLIFKHSLFNIVDYVFQPGPLISKIISFQHLFTIPFGIILLKEINKKTNFSWLISLIEVSGIFILTRIFTNPSQNINWSYHTSFNLQLPYYPLFWFIGMFVVIAFTNITLKKLFKI